MDALNETELKYSLFAMFEIDLSVLKSDLLYRQLIWQRRRIGIGKN